MIQLNHVSKEFTIHKHTFKAVDDVSIEVKAGEIFGIIGYSGAGKSTLLRCMNLLERPTGGEVYVDGQLLESLSKRDLQRMRSKVGMIFQHFHLLNSATVMGNIAFPLKLKKTSKADISDRVKELLDLVGLEGYEKKYPAQLSGGQKQRVAIARALANNPKVLLCDEATSALDPQTTRSILDLLLEINRRLGLTIVIVTHEMPVIQRICDCVAVIDEGHVVEQGTVAEVFLHARQRVTRQLLSLESAENLSLDKSAGGTLLEISFVGDTTYAPVLAEVAKETQSTFSILRGSVDKLKNAPFGRLVVAWSGSQEVLSQTVEKLRRRGCDVRFPEISAGSAQSQEGGVAVVH